jgi:DNA-binding transcriptional LysR family regulator
MAHFRKNIPSLNALVALEAATRNRSITLAAHELGVTQAAVSRQIVAIEANLGAKLFHRRHRAIEPTDNCLELAASLAASFAAIRQAVEQARACVGPQTVVIGATLAFSTLWLLPRLREFRDTFPAMQVRLVSRDSRIGLESGEVDLVIRYGLAPFDDGVVIGSHADELFPVCAPDFATRVEDADTSLADVQSLIENDVSDRAWYDWAKWFAQAGLRWPGRSPAMRFNHYTDALEAARAGQGIALGWKMLCDRFLSDRSLVRIGTRTVIPDGQYNVLLPSRREASPMAALAAQWLSGQLTAA